MNLEKLFETQAKLDELIVTEKGLEGQSLFLEKVLALLTELGELSNEWQGFKFWKEDNDPRTDEFILKKEFQHLHITQTGAYEFQLRDEFGKVIFDDVTDHHHDRRNLVLEEYVDCLHFILSIGNHIGVTDVNVVEMGDYTQETTTETFIYLSNDVWDVYKSVKFKASSHYLETHYELLFTRFVGLGELQLGFKWKDVEQAYFDKNEINHARQSNGY